MRLEDYQEPHGKGRSFTKLLLVLALLVALTMLACEYPSLLFSGATALVILTAAYLLVAFGRKMKKNAPSRQ